MHESGKLFWDEHQRLTLLALLLETPSDPSLSLP